MNQERSLKFLKIPYPFQHLAIHQGHSKILLLKKQQLIGQLYSKQGENFYNQKRTLIFSTRFYTSLRKITQYPYQDNINERKEIYDNRVDYLPKKSLSHVVGKLITQSNFDPMQSLLGFIITQKGSLAVSDHYKLKFFVAIFCVFQEFRFNNIQLTYFKIVYQMITQEENLVSSLALQQVYMQILLQYFFNFNKDEAYELRRISEKIFKDELFTYNLKNKCFQIQQLSSNLYQDQFPEKQASVLELAYLLRFSNFQKVKVVIFHTFFRQNYAFLVKKKNHNPGKGYKESFTQFNQFLLYQIRMVELSEQSDQTKQSDQPELQIR